MQQLCNVLGCDRPRLKRVPRCGKHENEYLMERNGPCPNHPNKPIFLVGPGFCNTCARRRVRNRHMTTDTAAGMSPNRELAGIIEYIAEEVIAVRAQLARYLRKRREDATPRVWVADNLLVLAHERLAPSHYRYLMARINEGAPAQERIVDYRSIA